MRPRLITAENVRRTHYRHLPVPRFNEAAAHHRGERSRPRPNRLGTACFNEAAAHHRGERPGRVAAGAVPDRASMRPRLITAENAPRVVQVAGQDRASMRPRLITAENSPGPMDGSGGHWRFNEAAAHHRGERAAPSAARAVRRGFNEAAAHHRGEPTARCSSGCSRSSFNEAAAHHRGEQRPLVGLDLGRHASMRPRLITAENADDDQHDHAHDHASMRPRLITAENCDRRRSPWRAGTGFNEAAAHHRGERAPPAGWPRNRHRLQ